MKLEKVDLSETGCFSSSFIEYVDHPEQLEAFFNRKPVIESFEDQIRDKKFDKGKRIILQQVLNRQYSNLTVSEKVTENIGRLESDQTFTITTGHQLNIFTGPLYFIYKIVTVINTCRELRKKYPKKNFIPVYWMASEDHDFEEISHFRFQGKKFEWKTSQTGAVGRFDPSEMKELLADFPVDLPLFKEAYLNQPTLADAVRYYVNELFGEEGLVVVDADDPELKRSFIPVIESDIFDQLPYDLVNLTIPKLEGSGVKAQVNPREINFFYLEDGLRSRIEKTGEGFELVDVDKKFSRDEMKEKIHSEPGIFSPNVILRPLYQEMILPNLAYIGGPSEVIYWLELKEIFDHFKIPFPILMPRNFALIIPSHTRKKWDKTGFNPKDLFKEIHVLEKETALKYSSHDLLLNGKSENVESTFASIREQAEKIDATLGPMVGAEAARAMKSLEKIEKKMIRAEKRKLKDKTGQVIAVKEYLFPLGGLQERKDNFLNFYLEDQEFIGRLVERFDPFDFSFHILSYE